MTKPKEVPIVTIWRMRCAADWRVRDVLAADGEMLELIPEGDVPIRVIFEDQCR